MTHHKMDTWTKTNLLLSALLIAATSSGSLCAHVETLLEEDLGEDVLPCQAPGYFSACDHTETCNSYYECKYTLIPSVIYVCPDGMVFNAKMGRCTETSIELRKLPTLNQKENLSSQLDEAVKSSQKICQLIQSVSEYQRTTHSVLQLKELSETIKLQHYVSNFNKDLETARDLMGDWVNGDSIVLAIRKLYSKAKSYEIEFDRMYTINQGRLAGLEGGKPALIQNYQEELESNTIKISKTTEMINTLSVSAEPSFKKYLEDDLTHQLNRNTELKKEIADNSPVALQLEELMYFLKETHSHASQIVDLANMCTQRLEKNYKDITKLNASIFNYTSPAENDYYTVKLESEKEKENTIHESIELWETLDDDATNNEVEADQDGPSSTSRNAFVFNREIMEFRYFISDLHKLVDTSRPAEIDMRGIMNGISQVNSAFQLITDDLNMMIKRGQSAEKDTERENAKAEILEALLLFQQQLDNSSQNMDDVNKCLF